MSTKEPRRKSQAQVGKHTAFMATYIMNAKISGAINADGQWNGMIHMSKRSTLQKKYAEAAAGKIIQKENKMFSVPEIKRSDGYEFKYADLIAQNKLLFSVDLEKEMLEKAYQQTTDAGMADIIDTCRATKNKHFCWFANLLENHYDGVITHASLKITSGKIEGINNKFKVVRRIAYGFHDDEYFFLKVIDGSIRGYVRNPRTPKVLH